MLGRWRAGGAWSPLSPLNALSATIDFMNEVGITWLFLHSRFAGDVDRIRAEVGSLEHVVCLDAPFPGGQPFSAFIPAGPETDVPAWMHPYGPPALVRPPWPPARTPGSSTAAD